jgi:hypothetical protein
MVMDEIPPLVEAEADPDLVARKRCKHDGLRSHFWGEIAVGRLRLGETLPSERRLAEMMWNVLTSMSSASGSNIQTCGGAFLYTDGRRLFECSLARQRG